MSESNGRPTWEKVAVGALSLLMLVLTLLFSGLQSKVDRQEATADQQNAVQAAMGAVQARQGAEIDGLQAQLNRIEAKLDRALDVPLNQRSTRPFP